MLQPLKKTRLYEEVIQQLLEHIRSGELKPGDRLPPERELAVQLGVSRTAIREALRAMETIGYVESKVGGGTFVRQITVKDVAVPLRSTMAQSVHLQADLVEIRLLLETEAAARAAALRNETGMRAIKESVAALEEAVEARQDGSEADRQFHLAVAQASGNEALVTVLDLCRELLHQTQKSTLAIPGQPARTLADHRRILNAIAAGDGAAASHAMRRHLEKAYLNLRTMAMESHEG